MQPPEESGRRAPSVFARSASVRTPPASARVASRHSRGAHPHQRPWTERSGLLQASVPQLLEDGVLGDSDGVSQTSKVGAQRAAGLAEDDSLNSFGLIVSVLKVIVGKGMLAHAYAYKLVGFGMFYLDCFVFAISYLQVLVLFCSLRDGEFSIWDAIHRSFGDRGANYWHSVIFLGRSSTLVMILCIMGGCVQEVMHIPVQVETLQSREWSKIFHPTRLQILLLCMFCCLVPTLCRMYRTLQYFSAMGVASCLSIFVVFVHVYAHNPHSRPGWSGADASVMNIPLVVGMSMYVSGGGDPSIADVLLRYTRGRPEGHSLADIAVKVGVSFVTGFVIVVGLAIGCYQMYGHDTQPNVVHNLSADPAQEGLLAPALVLLFCNGLCSYGLLGNVVFIKVEEETGWSPWIFRSCMLALYFVLAVLVPNVSTLITLSGCFIQGQYKFILPPLMFLFQHYKRDTHDDTRGCTPLLVIGSSFLLLIGLLLFGIGAMRILL